ncbi:glutathione S-transferase family protein [Nitratireductor rhodophyticola]|uniref:Glutathione S-transferase family protein n=1 Tax=Nitratireductor rhodophyticola TaxID=2854036 RepID=A0ABS7R9Y3_9HYPH|nr:glutathione S-transferase family protein [Nitratireductor rhodophyticola]MBY8917731.1 glutathione S-transferase family protein [Nitratireductor rhodophyticola]MBY8922442.1 glutathione S-transferase family protein [Nitratireductor rhodophyticola]MEC9244149.1 glutathione S-transferase family protein [Pseudomonadota bacterium]WPZ12616.1 glutathione S-transferase family protein [Nitratireductor rhodophyticola]
MEIFGDQNSGNCLKVKYTADHLGLAYRWRELDIMAGESRTEEFLAMSPFGQVPVVRFDDGRTLGQSGAIMRYLARGSALLPDDAFAAAEMDQWMFWEQNFHEPNVAGARFHVVYRREPVETRDPDKVERGEAALDFMDDALKTRDFFVGDALTIADIALLGYTRLAPQGGFELDGRRALTRWIARCEEVLGLPALQ